MAIWALHTYFVTSAPFSVLYDSIFRPRFRSFTSILCFGLHFYLPKHFFSHTHHWSFSFKLRLGALLNSKKQHILHFRCIKGTQHVCSLSGRLNPYKSINYYKVSTPSPLDSIHSQKICCLSAVQRLQISWKMSKSCFAALKNMYYFEVQQVTTNQEKSVILFQKLIPPGNGKRMCCHVALYQHQGTQPSDNVSSTTQDGDDEIL